MTESQQLDLSSSLEAEPTKQRPGWLSGLMAVGCLYLFISAVSMIGIGLKTIAKDPTGADFMNWLFGMVDNPMSGLFVGLLITSIVQSSSFTTSMTVGFVATGDISLVHAIPIIMGANIGTSITTILVSMAHIGRSKEFKRSFSAAIVHDFFNELSVIIFLPLEYFFGIISRPVEWVAMKLEGTTLFSADATSQYNFLKVASGFLGKQAKGLLLDVFKIEAKVAGTILAVVALILLFIALGLLVKVLRSAVMDRLSGAFSKTIFRNPPIAFAFGLISTAMVQSSSVTTSLVVPLVAAGVLELVQIFPYMMGANVGTTMTAMIAALGTGSAPAVACACGHMLFNIYGTVLFWPLQFVPISLAKGFAGLAEKRKYIAIAFLLSIFFVIPITVLIIMKNV